MDRNNFKNDNGVELIIENEKLKDENASLKRTVGSLKHYLQRVLQSELTNQKAWIDYNKYSEQINDICDSNSDVLEVANKADWYSEEQLMNVVEKVSLYDLNKQHSEKFDEVLFEFCQNLSPNEIAILAGHYALGDKRINTKIEKLLEYSGFEGEALMLKIGKGKDVIDRYRSYMRENDIYGDTIAEPLFNKEKNVNAINNKNNVDNEIEMEG